MNVMNVHGSNSLPKLPSVPLFGRGNLRTEIAYEAPVTEQVTLGFLPGDAVSAEVAGADYTLYKGEFYGGRGSSQLFTHKPKLDESGKPIFVTKTKQINVSSGDNLSANTRTGAVIGGILGGVLGGVVGLFLGMPALGALWGAGAGAALVGGSTALEESGEKARLEWREKTVKDETMVGFSRLENPIRDGWDREEYKADIQATSLGTYWEPVVVYSDSSGKVLREV